MIEGNIAVNVQQRRTELNRAVNCRRAVWCLIQATPASVHVHRKKKSPCHWLTAHDWETVDLVSPGHKLTRAVRAQRPAVCVLCVCGFVLCARSEVYVCTEIDAGALDSE